MSRVIDANEYGTKGSVFHRVVINVVTNEGDPEWVHVASDGTKSASPSGHTGNEVDGVIGCLLCKYNWNIEEQVFSNAELLKSDGAGGLESKTNDDLMAEVRTSLAGLGAKRTVSGLAGTTL